MSQHIEEKNRVLTPAMEPENIPAKHESDDYWERVRAWAVAEKSDGCTMVTQLYQDCCYEHDKAYKDGSDINGVIVSRRDADAQFRKCIQERSKLGRFSPISWIRWSGVRIGGWFLWRH